MPNYLNKLNESDPLKHIDQNDSTNSVMEFIKKKNSANTSCYVCKKRFGERLTGVWVVRGTVIEKSHWYTCLVCGYMCTQCESKERGLRRWEMDVIGTFNGNSEYETLRPKQVCPECVTKPPDFEKTDVTRLTKFPTDISAIVMDYCKPHIDFVCAELSDKRKRLVWYCVDCNLPCASRKSFLVNNREMSRRCNNCTTAYYANIRQTLTRNLVAVDPGHIDDRYKRCVDLILSFVFGIK